MSKAVALPTKENFTLVDFVYGDPAAPDIDRYTDLGRNYLNYDALNGLDIKPGPNVSGFGERDCTIRLPDTVFFASEASVREFSPIFVTVREVTRALVGGPEGSQQFLFVGRVVAAKRNPGGRAGIIELLSKPIKARIGKTRLGLPADQFCVWTLFENHCGATLVQRNAAIDTIDGFTITTSAAVITSPSSPGGDITRYWERGYVFRDGLRIGIHRWDSGTPGTMILKRRPPDEWLTGQVTFVPGCRKTIEACRDQWDQEETFMGLGYAMLPYNPLFQDA